MAPPSLARAGRRRTPRRRWLAVAIAFAALLALGFAPGDRALYPPAGGAGMRVTVVDHGWHAGLVVAAADLRAAALALGRERRALGHALRSLAAQDPRARWLEIGWGDDGFYRSVARIEDLTAETALAALLWPTPSVMHVAAFDRPPDEAFAAAERVTLTLSRAGFLRFATALAETLALGPGGAVEDRGPGLYGGARFYAAAPGYHAFNTCNHWVARLLRRAGVPASPLPGTFSTGLVAELRLRAARD
ncbi:MAG: DUF2459 domain-containing protein [Pseudomonadota bacterium]